MRYARNTDNLICSCVSAISDLFHINFREHKNRRSVCKKWNNSGEKFVRKLSQSCTSTSWRIFPIFTFLVKLNQMLRLFRKTTCHIMKNLIRVKTMKWKTGSYSMSMVVSVYTVQNIEFMGARCWEIPFKRKVWDRNERKNRNVNSNVWQLL